MASDYEEYLHQLNIKEESKRLYRPVLREYCRGGIELQKISTATARFRASVIRGYLKWKNLPNTIPSIPAPPKSKPQEYVSLERFELILGYLKLRPSKFISARDLLIFWLLNNRYRIANISYLKKDTFLNLKDKIFTNYFKQRTDDSDRLIVKKDGSPITDRTLRRKIRMYGERFGIVLTSKMLRDVNLSKSNLYK